MARGSRSVTRIFACGNRRDDRADVITIRRSFLHPARDRIKRAPERRRVRFHHEHQQILLRVRRIECRALKRLEKILARKCRVIAFAPLARAAEQHVGERLFR